MKLKEKSYVVSMTTYGSWSAPWKDWGAGIFSNFLKFKKIKSLKKKKWKNPDITNVKNVELRQIKSICKNKLHLFGFIQFLANKSKLA